MSAFISKKYMWRDGFSYKTDANVVGKVIESIEERDGQVTAVSFLDESRPEDSETHSMFEWNDSVAAEKYRLQQSKKILLQITYEIESHEDEVCEVELVDADSEEVKTADEAFRKPHAAWVNVGSKGRSGSPAIFVSVERALTDEDMRKTVLSNSIAEIKMFVNKYRNLVELTKIFNAVEEVEEELTLKNLI